MFHRKALAIFAFCGVSAYPIEHHAPEIDAVTSHTLNARHHHLTLFTSPMCGACQRFDPILSDFLKLVKENDLDIDVGRVNIDDYDNMQY